MGAPAQDADKPHDVLQPLTLTLHEFSALTGLTKLSIALSRSGLDKGPVKTVELAESLTGMLASGGL